MCTMCMRVLCRKTADRMYGPLRGALNLLIEVCVIGAIIYRTGWMTKDRANASPLPDPCSCVSYWQKMTA